MNADPRIQQVAAQPEPSLARDLLYAARYYLLSRTGLLVIGAVAIVAGAALNWNWLVATGIGPLLITLLPCAVMCGLGLCFHRLAGGSCAEEQSSPAVDAKPMAAPSAQLDLFEPPSSAHVREPIDLPETVSHESQTADERRHSHA
jgi:hypothetical protein